MRRKIALAVALCGILALLGSMVFPWFALPVGFTAAGKLILQDAPATFWWRLGLALLILAAWIIPMVFPKGLRRSVLRVCILAASLPWPIMYPQMVVIRDDRTSGAAAWLQQQYEDLVARGGDTWRAPQDRLLPAPDALNIKEPRLRIGAVRPPPSGLLSLGVSDLQDLVWWLGFSWGFAQFAGTGWFLALLGTFFLLVGALGWNQTDLRPQSRQGLLWLVGIAGCAFAALFGALGVVPIFRAGKALAEARDFSNAWRPRESLEALDEACRLMPALKADSFVVLQRGDLLARMGQEATPTARFALAQRQQTSYYVPTSIACFEELAKQPGLAPELRREALRGLLRAAILDLNAGRLPLAVHRLDLVLARDPSVVQAWFHRQWAALLTGDIASNRLAAERLAALVPAFGRVDSRNILVNSQWMLSQGEALLGNAEAAWVARRNSQGRR